jgi:Rrf2 family transcriptional regulator, iron-sulfur cluster assembly transcription factor
VGESVQPLPHQVRSEEAEDWVTFAVWNRLHQKIQDALSSITLEDLYYDARSWQAAQGSDASFIV